MKICPKCKYPNPDYLNECAKCKTDISKENSKEKTLNTSEPKIILNNNAKYCIINKDGSYSKLFSLEELKNLKSNGVIIGETLLLKEGESSPKQASAILINNTTLNNNNVVKEEKIVNEQFPPIITPNTRVDLSTDADIISKDPINKNRIIIDDIPPQINNNFSRNTAQNQSGSNNEQYNNTYIPPHNTINKRDKPIIILVILFVILMLIVSIVSQIYSKKISQNGATQTENTTDNSSYTPTEPQKSADQIAAEQIQAAKNSIKITSLYPGQPNSADRVDLFITWQNVSGKVIKYAHFEVEALNAVDDIVMCDINHDPTFLGRDTGPYQPGEIRESNYEYAWYNSTITKVRLISAKIEYMDGTTQKIERAYTQYLF